MTSLNMRIFVLYSSSGPTSRREKTFSNRNPKRKTPTNAGLYASSALREDQYRRTQPSLSNDAWVTVLFDSQDPTNPSILFLSIANNLPYSSHISLSQVRLGIALKFQNDTALHVLGNWTFREVWAVFVQLSISRYFYVYCQWPTATLSLHSSTR